ncbi:MAG: ASCH domain-containing protein [Acidimicrobiales bacterium]
MSGRRSLEIGSPGEMRQRLNALILRGEKRATAGLANYYAVENEVIESVGERLMLVDDEMQPIATVVVVRVEVTAFADVPFEFAQAESEGDESIEEWREGHRSFWVSEGEVIDDLTPVVLIWFELVNDASTATSGLS